MLLHRARIHNQWILVSHCRQCKAMCKIATRCLLYRMLEITSVVSELQHAIGCMVVSLQQQALGLRLMMETAWLVTKPTVPGSKQPGGRQQRHRRELQSCKIKCAQFNDSTTLHRPQHYRRLVSVGILGLLCEASDCRFTHICICMLNLVVTLWGQTCFVPLQ